MLNISCLLYYSGRLYSELADTVIRLVAGLQPILDDCRKEEWILRLESLYDASVQRNAESASLYVHEYINGMKECFR
ncbi:MAG: hypothetical protein K0R28_5304 [Paenibacillus sp.]|nr:hypothetical protein [Paenibacillus sp.]